MKRYLGDPPKLCDMCGRKITSSFIDGATVMGLWAFMCGSCHTEVGVGLGAGKGQKYARVDDGGWKKIAG